MPCLVCHTPTLSWPQETTLDPSLFVTLWLLFLCPQTKPQDEAAIQAEAQSLRSQFMALMRQLFDSQLDSSSFEDACRSLLGTNSYVLFTLDKLVLKFVKHLQVWQRGSYGWEVGWRRGPVGFEGAGWWTTDRTWWWSP